MVVKRTYRKFFSNSYDQGFYENYGYVKMPLKDQAVIDPLLDGVKEIIDTMDEDLPEGVFASGRSHDKKLKLKVQALLDRLVPERLIEILVNESVAPLGGTLLLKSPGSNSFLYPHLDNPVIDERVSSSIFAWIPLQDVTVDNGCVCVLPASHKINHFGRGMGVPYMYVDVNEVTYKNSIPIEMKKGEVLFMDHALIHYSLANETDQIRYAAEYSLRPQNESQLHLYKDIKDDMLSIYEIDPHFFFNENIFIAPPEKYKLVGQVEPFVNPYSEVEFDAVIKRLIKKSKRNMFLRKFVWWG